ncbi:MAG: BtpA/SgcQ family protein [Patescibacteria group bacterium]
MKHKISALFGKSKGIIMGAVHFPPLLGYPNFPGFPIALRNALADVKTMTDGGVDGVIFENNYDLPHRIFVEPPVIAAMTHLGHHLKNTTKNPCGEG